MIASVGGFLFGFDTAVISGALSSLISQFELAHDPVLQGWLVSSVLMGSVLGAIISGYITDLYGRRWAIRLAAILYMGSALGSAFSPSLDFFLYARLIGGIGVGIAAMAVPLYISEVSPPKIRGGLVSFYQMAIAAGVLCAYFSNEFIGGFWEKGLPHENVLLDKPWRLMLGVEIVPALLFFLMLLFVPKSPRFVLMKKKNAEAFKILSKFGNQSFVREQVKEIKEGLSHESGSLKELFMGQLKKATFIALFMSIISQFSGIDIILHYGPLILEAAGFSSIESLNGQVIFGLILVIFTALAIWKVDRLGRKKILLIGNFGITVALLAIGYLFMTNSTSQIFVLIAISVFVASFAFSLGPLPWIIMSEIFPTKLRGRAMAMATVALFGANWLIAQIFPWLSTTFGEGMTFIGLALLMLPTFPFVLWMLPETKGKSLEEIESTWTTPKKSTGR